MAAHRVGTAPQTRGLQALLLAGSAPLLASLVLVAPSARAQQAAPAARQPASAPAAGQGTSAPAAPAPAAPAAPARVQVTPTAPQATPAATTQAEPRVLISEVAVRGLEGHPEKTRLELAVYDAMTTRPGTRVTRNELQADLSAIYATGWFTDVNIRPVDSPLGVQLVVTVAPNPVLTKVSLDPSPAKIPASVVQDTFASDYGKTLNLTALQTRMQELQKWYADQGYSLARISGPTRVSPSGDVQLLVREGTVQGVDVQFLNKEGSATDDKDRPIRGKTKPWVITREISIKPGSTFNRRVLEEDIKRLYGTGLFGDVKVSLKPVPGDPGTVVIVLGIVEQSTGSLSGGLGYSQSQGVFGQIQLQDSNFLGRAYDISTNFTYGQFGGLADVSFTDPWIKGDKYRTSFRTRLFLSREVPQVFQSQTNGSILTAVGGNTVALQRTGASVQLVRPLNGRNPFRKAPWSVVVGLGAQEVVPMNFTGANYASGVAPDGTTICLAYTSNANPGATNCATRNQLVSLRVAAAMNTLNDPRNPTKGNFFSVGTEQFVSVGPDSPTFNRLKASFTHYIPVTWLKLFKGCRPKRGETPDCKQALAFQVNLGTNLGQLPPYEAFCLGGANSVRGFYDCNLGSGRSYGEATIEYRFPLFSIISGELFVDAGSTFGSQAAVPGNPGALLGKPGEGFSVGTGVIVTTPVGPLRLEVASQNFTGNWRFNLGVGWKF
ncbi:MAG: BamA/TamA family outer membrane protein [Cyanobacteriota bacterium]